MSKPQDPDKPQPQLTIAQAYAQAVSHFNARRYGDSLDYCNAILQAEPKQVDASNLLATIAQQVMQQAIAFHHDGNLVAAIEWYRKTLEIQPANPAALNNLGGALQGQGQAGAALECYQRAIASDPNHQDALSNLGAAQKDLGNLDGAVGSLQKLVAINPNQPDLYGRLGDIYKMQGKLNTAIDYFHKALSLAPDNHEILNSLGVAFKEIGELEKAVASYRQALVYKPDYADVYNNLGNVLGDLGQLDAAVANYKVAIAHNPGSVAALNNLGVALTEQCELVAAIDCYKKAITNAPHNQTAHSNLLFTTQYLPGQSLKTLLIAHQGWAATLPANLKKQLLPHKNDPSPNRRLRLGLVSPDLGRHPVGYFMLGLIKSRPKSELEIICYSDRIADAMSKELKKHADGWLFSKALSNHDLARRINADKIDILIDLAGHTENNRLLTFAMRPAPIQISWAGYVGTTGLATMDYLLADNHYVHRGEEQYYTEQIIRLPDSWVCYTPPEYAAITTPQAVNSKERGVMLGNFGSPAKINSEMLEVWADILKKIPDASLLLKYRGMDNPSNIKRIKEQLAKKDIVESRIIIEGKTPHPEFLGRYHDVDIALDTLPYSGGLTTFEALWMGVPVVSVVGDTFAGRHSTSILNTLGLSELVASDLAGYVELVVELATNRKKLQLIRAGLSQRLLNSPLCNHEKFSQDLSRKLRKVWQKWCLSQATPAESL